MTTELLYGAYILMWPALTLGVLAMICGAVFKDMRRARANGDALI
ncbi:MAG TPA: putative transporter small subunit [Marinobacter sp.]|nr:putative transporter small subunit [Marinobacter sp.]